MQAFHDLVTWLNGYLWGPPMLAFLFGTHVFLTFRLRFVQRYLGKAIRLSAKPDPDSPGDVSQFGALATAMAATIGTGNIVGVATAVTLGGPGAVLWMWLTGVFGFATKYSEALLAVKYRVRTEDGSMLGGPMYAMEKGLGARWLAILFCMFTVVASFGIGNMVQSNAVASFANDTFHISAYVTGTVTALLTSLVILGGIRSIALVCEALVPLMAVGYVIGCLVILTIQSSYLGDALVLIVRSALGLDAMGGGAVGAGIAMVARYGIARGLFSNEAGLGSAPIVAAAARTRNPVRQALVSASATFWDTVVICAITGLVLVTSLVKNPDLQGLQGPALTQAAFDAIPVIGPPLLIFGLLTFVYSTILGWAYYGERALEYLAGKRAILPFRMLWVVAVMVGAVIPLPLVWDFADAANALMAIPNLIALVALSSVIVAETREYLWEDQLDREAPMTAISVEEE